MLHDWPIQTRADCCAHTGQPFADGDFFYTLLFQDRKTGALERRDVCERAWHELAAREDADAARPFSFWRSKFTLPPPPAPETLPKENAESLLRRFLAGGPAPEHSRACYILALMLERKRLLRPRDTRDDAAGRRLLFYEHAKTGESFVVADPRLKLDQLEEVQREVAALLSSPEASNEAPPASNP